MLNDTYMDWKYIWYIFAYENYQAPKLSHIFLTLPRSSIYVVRMASRKIANCIMRARNCNTGSR